MRDTETGLVIAGLLIVALLACAMVTGAVKPTKADKIEQMNRVRAGVDPHGGEIDWID